MATTPKGKKKKVAGVQPTVAIHLQHDDGEHHAVGIGNLRVIIHNDDGSYFAQGLEIDYAAQGDSVEEVKKNFEDGLHATLRQHLKMFGKIDGILRVAPQDVWQAAFRQADNLSRLTMISQLKCDKAQSFPFGAIKYMTAGESHY